MHPPRNPAHQHLRPHAALRLRAPRRRVKRSSVKLGNAGLNHVESYAMTVGKIDRFDNQKAKWTGYPIGVECDDFVEEKRVPQD